MAETQAQKCEKLNAEDCAAEAACTKENRSWLEQIFEMPHAEKRSLVDWARLGVGTCAWFGLVRAYASSTLLRRLAILVEGECPMAAFGDDV